MLSPFAAKLNNLGVVDGQSADCPGAPNGVFLRATDMKHQTKPIPFAGPPDQALQRIRGLVDA
jgi:uncharacterized protein (DUF1499 family)